MRLELQDLSISYGRGRDELVAVDGVDLEIAAGGTVGLVGESGCGKSTVARGIVGLLPLRHGRILLDGVDYTEGRKRSRLEFRRRVQMVFQDPYGSLNPRMPVDKILREALASGTARPSGRGTAEDVGLLVSMVGLPATVLGRFPHQLSGGQRQRVAIARALAVHPDLVILDEVTSALDVSVQAGILNLLRELQRELQLSYLFISHDLSTVRYMSDTISVMYLGRIVESAGTEELFGTPRHPYTQSLIQSVPQLGSKRPRSMLAGDLPNPRHPPAGCRFHPRCPVGPLYRTDRQICTLQDPQTIAQIKEHQAACHFVDTLHSADEILTVRQAQTIL